MTVFKSNWTNSRSGLSRRERRGSPLLSVVLLLVGFAPALAVAQTADTPAKDVPLPAARRALLVAAQNYDSRSFGPLPNACAEIREIDGALDQLGYAQRTLVCDDAPDAGRKPRKANIQRALAETVAAAGPEDTLFILVSLHGLAVEGNVYLCPLDVCDRRLDLDRIDEVAISVQAVYRQLETCRAKHKILILEICRTEVGDNADAGAFRSLYTPPKNTTVFCSCAEDQRSWTCPGLNGVESDERSAFLFQAKQALRGGADIAWGNNGRITVSEFVNYVTANTTDCVDRRLGREQTPHVFGEGWFEIGSLGNRVEYIDVRVPMDDRLRGSLQQLADAGNAAVRQIRRRVMASRDESLQLMNRTPRIGKMSTMRNVRVYADEVVADAARLRLLGLYEHDLDRIKTLCFDTNIQLTNDPTTLCYRGDMYKNMGRYSDALADYNEAGKDFTLFARLNAPVYKPGVGTPYGTIIEVTGAAEDTGASEATPDESTGQQGKPRDDAEKKAPDNEYCRVVVKRIADSGKTKWMNVVIHDLGGEPINAWVLASDVMWSSDLAEYYWISSGMRSQRYRNAVAVIQTKVQRIHTAIGAYDTVARLLSMGGIPLPSIGGYAQMAEQAIRRTVHSRIAIRRGTAYGLVGREYIDTWWRLQQRFLEQQLSPPVEGAKSTILFQD